MIHVKARPRIHIALADMGFASPRAYGGVGFSIDGPITAVDVLPEATQKLVNFDCLDNQSVRDIRNLSARLFELTDERGFCVRLQSTPPQHVGFGSKTALALAVIAGVNALHQINLTQQQMQLLSCRGGASGIGVHAFFAGGVIWDGGHAASKNFKLEPSSASTRQQVPPLMLRIPFPQEWHVALILPKGSHISGEVERTFFTTNAPINRDDSFATMAALYHGVLPAFRLTDLSALARALRAIHTTGFKALEVGLHGEATQSILQCLHARGFCAGMSSLGPLIYTIIHRDDTLSASEVAAISESYGARWLGLVKGHNAGFEITSGRI